jgi:hypothetical protein
MIRALVPVVACFISFEMNMCAISVTSPVKSATRTHRHDQQKQQEQEDESAD